jgi:hypothetical protein
MSCIRGNWVGLGWTVGGDGGHVTLGVRLFNRW